ncbi:hypothetical protein Tco_1418080 [Tanacetum coccineum]
MELQSESNQTLSALKLHMLKIGDYDLWSMRMEQYLTHTDYALWEVIVNSYAPAVALASAEGPIPPKIKFHGIKDAKSLWEAIKNRFGGNRESKKMQKTILKQNYENFDALSQEGLDKVHDRFQKLISQLEIHDTLSTNDLYNNLKVYEAEVKGQSSSSSNSQNVAFVSLDNTSSTNEAVNTTNELSVGL